MTGQSTRQSRTPGNPAFSEQLTWQFATEVARLGATLLLSASATLLVLFFSWRWTAHPLDIFDGVLSPQGLKDLYPSAWLTWGHASVTAVFLVTNLVNRRYGEQVALAHVVSSSIVAGLLAAAANLHLITLPGAPDAPVGVREVAAFLTGMTLGQVASIVIFDRTRGVEWWNAPAYAALSATLVAMPVFYALAYAGSGWVWLNHMAIDIALKALMAFALLVPYFLFRPVVRPVEGLGGF